MSVNRTYNFTPFKGGQPISAAELNRLQEAIRALQPIDTATVKWSRSPSGIAATAKTIGGHGDTGGKWSYRVSRGDNDHHNELHIAAGNRKIIGNAYEQDAEQWVEIPEGATGTYTIRAIYYYGTGGNYGSWHTPIFGIVEASSMPADDGTKVVFALADIEMDSGDVTAITHRHMGDMVVLDIQGCPQ